MFIQGKDFELIVDHQALIPILNNKYLDEIQNLRIQRMKEKLWQYRFMTSWRKGSLHTVADVLSRHPVSEPENEDNDLNLELDFSVNALEETQNESFENTEVNDMLLKKIKASTLKDPGLIILKELIKNGFPKQKCELQDDIKEYWRIRDELSIYEDMILWGQRIIIPKELRKDMIKAIHAGHFGIAKCLARAHKTFFWPGYVNDINNHIKNCKVCVERSPSQQKEPFIFSESNEAFEMIHSDIFQFAGKEFLVFIDNYSGWWSIGAAQRMTSGIVIGYFQKWFASYGIPKRLITDGGSVFTSSVFESWCKDWNIVHSVSSPYNPQSNGKAENAVKIAKNLLAKTSSTGDLDNEYFLRGLLEQRNTPGPKGKSPAELVYGKFTRSFVPQLGVRLRTKNDSRAVPVRPVKGRILAPLEKGQGVWVQNYKTKRWDQQGTVIEQRNDRRSYIVNCNGVRVWRNRRFLKPRITKQRDDQSNTSIPQSLVNQKKRDSVKGANWKYEPNTIAQRKGTRTKRLPIRFRD